MQHLIYLKRSNPYLKGILRCNSSDILKILANKKLESTKINKRYLTEYRTNTFSGPIKTSDRNTESIIDSDQIINL